MDSAHWAEDQKDDVRGGVGVQRMTLKKQYQGSSKDPSRAIITLVENVLNNLLCKKKVQYLFI